MNIQELILKYTREKQDIKTSLNAFRNGKGKDVGIMTSICAHQIIVIEDVLNDLRAAEEQYKTFIEDSWYDEKYVQHLKDEIERLQTLLSGSTNTNQEIELAP